MKGTLKLFAQVQTAGNHEPCQENRFKEITLNTIHGVEWAESHRDQIQQFKELNPQFRNVSINALWSYRQYS
jgi:hypothetical protein